MGFIYCEMKVGKKKIKKASVLVARKGAKLIVGRDWLNLLAYKIGQKKQGQLNNSINLIKIKLLKAIINLELFNDFSIICFLVGSLIS